MVYKRVNELIRQEKKIPETKRRTDEACRSPLVSLGRRDNIDNCRRGSDDRRRSVDLLLWHDVRRERGEILFLVHRLLRGGGIIRRGRSNPLDIRGNPDQASSGSGLFERHISQINAVLGLDVLYESRTALNSIQKQELVRKKILSTKEQTHLVLHPAITHGYPSGRIWVSLLCLAQEEGSPNRAPHTLHSWGLAPVLIDNNKVMCPEERARLDTHWTLRWVFKPVY